MESPQTAATRSPQSKGQFEIPDFFGLVECCGVAPRNITRSKVGPRSRSVNAIADKVYVALPRAVQKVQRPNLEINEREV